MAQECEKLTTCGFFQEIRWSQRLGLQGVHQPILQRW